MAFKTRLRREPLRLPEITLVPLIDTVLTLLIIFMLTAPMMRMSLKVDLPDSKTAQTTNLFSVREVLTAINRPLSLKPFHLIFGYARC